MAVGLCQFDGQMDESGDLCQSDNERREGRVSGG